MSDGESPFAWVRSPRTVLVVLAVAVLVGTLAVASTSAASFGPYNSDWNGASALQDQARSAGADPTVLQSVSAYEELAPDRTVAVVLSPDEPYTSAETATLASFVRSGGTLVVAEDTGPYGNDLLAGVGARARVDDHQLRDDRNNYRSPALPVAKNVSDHPTTEGVDQVTLNYGTAVDPNGATVLVRTSSFAYLDENGNERLDDDETLRRYPVATVEEVGEGRVIVLGDPSVLINAMLTQGGNERFVRNVFGTGDVVALDYSHAAGLPPVRVALLTLRDSPLLQAVVGIVAVGAIAVLAARRDAPWIGGDSADDDEPFVTPEDVRGYLRENHPEWDESRRERLAKGVLSGPDEREKR